MTTMNPPTQMPTNGAWDPAYFVASVYDRLLFVASVYDRLLGQGNPQPWPSYPANGRRPLLQAAPARWAGGHLPRRVPIPNGIDLKSALHKKRPAQILHFDEDSLSKIQNSTAEKCRSTQMSFELRNLEFHSRDEGYALG
jgi:hypothetical protein